MVNPDGAERFKRRNFYDIDLNRDASRLQCPEAVILKSVFDSLKADFGFNLHDQSHRYSVGNSFRTATISFLAPAYNYEKDFNDVRGNAVKLIGNMYQALIIISFPVTLQNILMSTNQEHLVITFRNGARVQF